MSQDSNTPNPDPLDFMAKPTTWLRQVVTHQQAHLAAPDFAQFLGAIRSAFQKYTNKLLEFSPGAERATALHVLIDRELATATKQIAPSCTEGCCGCCHYEVEITSDEAALLLDAVQTGCTVDVDRLRVQAARERESPKWFQFWSPENRCVFLSAEGTCRVYEQRPAICRKHLVTNPPEACTTPGAAIAPIQSFLAEILLSAALSIPDTPFASISKMLLPRLEPTR